MHAGGARSALCYESRVRRAAVGVGYGAVALALLGAMALALLGAACGDGARSTGAAEEAGVDASPDGSGDADDRGDVACAPFEVARDEPYLPVGLDSFDATAFGEDTAHETVTERATGLVFEKAPKDDLTFDEAACRCKDLRTASATDWRLASRFELARIVDYVKVVPPMRGPAFDVALFPDAPIDSYWTSTRFTSRNVAQTNVPYTVVLGDGTVIGAAQTAATRASAWCVRGGKRPSGTRFSSAADVVTDRWTNLTWQRSVPTEALALDYAGALAYCSSLSLGGLAGFRLPGIKELQTLVDVARRSPSIDPGLFPSTPALLFHTSAAYRPQPGSTRWFVDFDDGAALPATVGSGSSRPTQPVRCVRSAP